MGRLKLRLYTKSTGTRSPPNLSGWTRPQRILGYQVTLDSPAIHIQNKTRGKSTRLSKSKAHQFIKELVESNVPIRSGDGKAQPRIVEVKPEVTLTLLPDDSLLVEPELVSTEGVVLPKPPSLERTRARRRVVCSRRRPDKGHYHTHTARCDARFRRAKGRRSLDMMFLTF